MKIEKQDLIDDLKRIHKIVKDIPTVEEYRKHGRYGVNTIKRKFGSWSNASLEIFGSRNGTTRGGKIETKCSYCSKKLILFKSVIRESNYCSRQCAAKKNNKTPKRKLSKQCSGCNALVYSGYMYCASCHSGGKHLKSNKHMHSRSIREVISCKGSNKYGAIRCHARSITKCRDQVCEVCKYDKHVETCHKKEIKDFPLDTKIEVVNHPMNLSVLCRNHHWELDHDCLTF